MPDPVAAASRFSGFPAWVLLDPFASFGECRNHTTATSLTSFKRPIEVSFELVDPPRVSRWFVRLVGQKNKKRGFYGPPSILNSSGSFVVILMSFYRDDGRILDYFVYKAVPGKPSLDLIPGPCPTVNFPKLIGILPSDDGGHYSVIFPVPEFRHNPMYKILVFSSAVQSWSTKFASICSDSETTYHEAVVHHPRKAIAVGRGSLAWIDLWRGVLLCNGLDEDNPVLRLIEWPVPLPCSNAMDLYPAGASRGATLSDGTIRFVKIEFHYSGCCHSRDAIPIGWTATMWKRRCSLKEWEWEWEMCFEVDIAKILTNHSSSSDLLQKVWDTQSNKLDLNKVSSAMPILSLTNEDIVYFMMNLFSEEALLIAVNVRKKKLEAVEQISSELLCSPCSFSRLLDAGSAAGGEGGRQREEIDMTEANGGGAALRRSAGEVDSSVEDKVVAAEHSSPTCTGAQVIATELSENHLINCGSSENVFLEDTDTGAQIDASELSENGLVDCSSNSIEIVNEGSGTELLIACTNGSQNIVGHPAEREDSFDEYQVASLFLHQSDSEDGAAPSSVFCTEMNNLNAISVGSCVTTNLNSLETNGLLKDQFSGEPNMTDLFADSKVGRNSEDDLFELPTESCFLEVPNAVESRQQVDSTSLMVDQPTVSNQVQQCHNSNERILSASSTSEYGEVVCPEDIPVSSSSELVNKTCLTDHGLQENGHTSGDIFVPSQAASMEFSTISMQDISALSEVEEIMQTEDASAKDMTAVCSIDCIEMKQAINTTANDTYAANVEEKKLIEGSAAGMNEVRRTDYVEQTQASDTKELSAVQNIGNFEENKQTEDTDAKETNKRFNANDVEHKTQTAKEMAAAEITCSVEEKQQLDIMVGQDGSNNKLNEEIAPLNVLFAQASMENQAKKLTKERVLSFRRWVTKDSNLSVKSGSPKSGCENHHWSSPDKLPHMDVYRSSKEKKTSAQLNSGRVRVPLQVLLAEASMEDQMKKPSTNERVRLPHKDVDRSSKGNKQPWMPVICCHSVH